MNTGEATATPSFLDSLLEEAPETLPILKQSCIRVLNLTQDARSSASDIGDVIMHDQAMMANVIKIANSPAYHTRVPVKTPTHAVALIGFDVIRAMTVAAQLIEQADTFGANTQALKRHLARALVAGTQAQELGKALQYGETGFLFTNAMLYSLGDLLLALCRPEIANQLEHIRQTQPQNIPKAELNLLGRPLSVIASTMAKHWHLPQSLIQVLQKKPVWPKTRPDADQEIMAGIVRGANELSYCLLNPTAVGQAEVLQGLVKQFLPPFGFSFPQLKDMVAKAFMQAAEIASAINIDPHYLLPTVDSEGPPLQHKELLQLTKTIDQVLRLEDPPEQKEEFKEKAPPEKENRTVSSPDHLLFDFTLQAMKITDPSNLLTFTTRTLHEHYHFPRVLLAFLVPGKDMLEAKLGYGNEADHTVSTFRCSTLPETFWGRVLEQFQPIRFSSLAQESKPGEIPPEFLDCWGGQPGIAGPLYTPTKPIGLILADFGSRSREQTHTDFAAFALLLAQTNANLARLAQK